MNRSLLALVAGFLQKLQTYDKDNIPPEVIAKIRPYMDNPDFEPEVVKKASKAAYGLVSWVRAMEAYDRYSSSRVPCAFTPPVCSQTVQATTQSSSKQSQPLDSKASLAATASTKGTASICTAPWLYCHAGLHARV